MAISSPSPKNDALEFLQRAFGAIPETAGIFLFTLPDRSGARFRVGQLDKAVAWAAANQKQNVYIEAAWAHATYGDRRVQAQDTAGIVGLWADVDVAGDGHAGGKVYPPSKQDAMALLIDEIPLPPSLVIDSGHGLQAWWLFQEPWSFDSDAERASAADLAKRWTDTLRSYAQRHGWTLDSTGDLARLMRLPGTQNVKDLAAVLAVELVPGINERRYQPDDFNEYLVDTSPSLTGIIDATGLVFDPDAEPPGRKFRALLSNDTQFKQSWERNRKDFKEDNSASAYDMSLAHTAISAGWTDQEVINLLIAGRAEHGDDIKLDSHGNIRRDYYLRTIGKLRAELGLSAVVEQVHDAVDSGDADEIDSARTSLLNNISAQFDVRVTRIVKYTAQTPVYRLVTEKGDILLGTASDLLGQHKVRAAVVSVADVVPPKFKDARWRTILQAMIKVADVEEPSQDLSETGQVTGWLSDYISANPASDHQDSAIASRRPFRRKDCFAFFLDHFKSWLFLKKHEQIETRDLSIQLHNFGARSERVMIVVNGRRTSRSVWLIADDLGEVRNE